MAEFDVRFRKRFRLGRAVSRGRRERRVLERIGLRLCGIAHAAAQTNSPVQQGVIAMLGTFIDTTVVCTMTALAI